MASFDLTTNPFWLLKTSIRARQRDVVAALELAVSNDAASESDLIRAQQILLAPMTRLDAELGWLPELSPARAGALVGVLATGPPKETAIPLLDGLEGVSRVNLAADICRRYPGDVALVAELVRSYQSLSLEAVEEAINANRTVAGFGQVDSAMMKLAFTKTERAHAEAATSCLTAAASPGMALSGLIVGAEDPSSPLFEFLDATMRSYRAWSEPRLRRIDDAIQKEIDSMKSSPGDLGFMRSLCAGMALWAEWNSPLVLWDRAKGLDEPRAYAIYGRLRDLSLWLANDMNRYKEALEITEGLRTNFASLPSVSKQLDEDATILRGLVRNESISTSIDALKRAIASINLTGLDAALLAKGFGHNATGLAKSLYESFDSAIIATRATEHVDVPWKMIRSVMIDLKSQQHEESSELLGIALLTIAPGKASAEFVAVLEGDCKRTVESLQKAGKKAQALSLLHTIIAFAREDVDVDQAAKLYVKIQACTDISDNDVDRAAKLYAKIQADTGFKHRNDEDRVKIAADIANEQLQWHRNKHRAWKWVTALALGAVLLAAGVTIAVGNRGASDNPASALQTSSPTSTSQVESVTGASPANPLPSTTEPAAAKPSPLPSGDTAEIKPPAGEISVLSQEELRYCVFQEARIERAKTFSITNDEISNVNRVLEDFNARCSRYSYDKHDMAAVQSELRDQQFKINEDAQSLVDGAIPNDQ